MKKTLILLRGLPGSGKTTFAQLIANGAPIFAADDYFYDNSNVKYLFDSSKLGEAHSRCKRNVENQMIESTPLIIVTNTFTTQKEINPYIEMAKHYSYNVTSIIVENRHGNKSVHNVPDETVLKMKERFVIEL